MPICKYDNKKQFTFPTDPSPKKNCRQQGQSGNHLQGVYLLHFKMTKEHVASKWACFQVVPVLDKWKQPLLSLHNCWRNYVHILEQPGRD